MEDQSLPRKFNISCCRSYLTPKGRCYTCPEFEEEVEDQEGIELKMDKDPDQEKW